jgi:uncharacterized membrane protein
MHNPTSRLETFCDGVFAIAITLLILGIKVPMKENISSSHTLLQALTEAWPSWFAFLLSFGSILVTWSNHHSAFKQINKSSALFNYVNGFFLLTIVILPYPTALLAEYINTDSARTAILVYCLALVLHNVAWILLFQTILKPKSLSKNEAAKKIILKGRKHSIHGFIAYALIAILATWFPMIALCLLALLWVIWIIIGIFMSGIDTETI